MKTIDDLLKEIEARASRSFRDVPPHEHSHSLWVRCLSCQAFGVPLPSRFLDAAECGNCASIETVKYYPSCCIVADRDSTDVPTLIAMLRKAR